MNLVIEIGPKLAYFLAAVVLLFIFKYIHEEM